MFLWREKIKSNTVMGYSREESESNFNIPKIFIIDF